MNTLITKRKIRYLLIESSAPIDVTKRAVSEELSRNLILFLGELTNYRANPHINSQIGEKVFLLRINRGFEREVLAALATIKKSGGVESGFYTLKISGTAKKLITFYRRHIFLDAGQVPSKSRT